VLALQALYESESVGHDPCSAMTRLASESSLSEKLTQFASELVTGVKQHEQEIDGHIRRYAPAWPVEQLALLDRNILRLAIFEILYDNSSPVKVAINEAVELAKAFGTDSSARFINGVLGSLVADSPKAP
jgi:transcription antitermination protein NusB